MPFLKLRLRLFPVILSKSAISKATSKECLENTFSDSDKMGNKNSTLAKDSPHLDPVQQPEPVATPQLPTQLPKGREKEYLEKKRAYYEKEKYMLTKEKGRYIGAQADYMVQQWAKTPEIGSNTKRLPRQPREDEIDKRLDSGIYEDLRHLDELEYAFLKAEVDPLEALTHPEPKMVLFEKLVRLFEDAKAVVALAEECDVDDLRETIDIEEAKGVIAAFSAQIDRMGAAKGEPPAYKN